MKPFMTRVKILCLCLAAAFVLACGPAPSTGAANTDFAGKWVWKTTVEAANNASVCPMKTSDSATDTVTIASSGSGLALTGFLGTNGNALNATLSAGTGGSLQEMNFHGSYPQGTGTTVVETTSVASFNSATMMSGEESWTWTKTGTTTSCTGISAVTATKLP